MSCSGFTYLHTVLTASSLLVVLLRSRGAWHMLRVTDYRLLTLIGVTSYSKLQQSVSLCANKAT